MKSKATVSVNDTPEAPRSLSKMVAPIRKACLVVAGFSSAMDTESILLRADAVHLFEKMFCSMRSPEFLRHASIRSGMAQGHMRRDSDRAIESSI
jgi:hypothetical protein